MIFCVKPLGRAQTEFFLTSGFADFERGNAISNCMTSISTIMSQFGSVDFDPHKVGLIPLTISN
jgi:hypothetical protein